MNGLRRDLSILEASYCTIFEKRGTYATFTATIRQQGGFTHRYIRHLLDIAFGKAIRSAREVPTDQRDQEKKSVGDIERSSSTVPLPRQPTAKLTIGQ